MATGKLKITKLTKRYTLKQASKLAAAGKAVTLKLKLPARARKSANRALKKHRTVTAMVVVIVQAAAGNKASKHLTIKLTRRRRTTQPERGRTSLSPSRKAEALSEPTSVIGHRTVFGARMRTHPAVSRTIAGTARVPSGG